MLRKLNETAHINVHNRENQKIRGVEFVYKMSCIAKEGVKKFCTRSTP